MLPATELRYEVVLAKLGMDESILSSCINIFNESYGIWSPDHIRSGHRIILSKAWYKRQLNSCDCGIVRAFVGEGVHIGHVLYKHFISAENKVCWITQLVVRKEYRSKKVAQTLIRRAIEACDDISIAGIASTHPHALLALVKATGNSIDPIYVQQHAKKIVSDSHIEYLNYDGELTLCNGVDCLIDSNFDVDHTEPMEKLALISNEKWTLGRRLPAKHEFLAVIPINNEFIQTSNVVDVDDDFVRCNQNDTVLGIVHSVWTTSVTDYINTLELYKSLISQRNVAQNVFGTKPIRVREQIFHCPINFTIAEAAIEISKRFGIIGGHVFAVISDDCYFLPPEMFVGTVFVRLKLVSGITLKHSPVRNSHVAVGLCWDTVKTLRDTMKLSGMPKNRDCTTWETIVDMFELTPVELEMLKKLCCDD